MHLSLVNFHQMGVTVFREISSHHGDDDSMKKHLVKGKSDFGGFIHFLDMK